MSTPAPLVGVVVVNYGGGDLTLACLHSLLASEWPTDRLRVVLVDNASDDGVAARVAEELPAVEVLRSETNLGFAGGCNLGIRHLDGVDHVALVNNDATVDPAWLAPLVDALDDDPRLGAACPKILFAGRYRELTLATTTSRRGRGDRRELGVRLSGARLGDRDVWTRTQLVDGFWGAEPADATGTGEWTGAHATLRVPVGHDTPARASLRIASDSDRTVRVGPGAGAELEVTTTPSWYEVPLDGPVTRVVNNVGSVLTDDLHGADRGYQQPDDGRFDSGDDVFAWCGAGVVLRRAHLDDIGLFDERLFLYYEDLELSWRGRAHGWRYRYVPESVVHHMHAASTGEGSALKDHYNERNRLLVLTRHAPAGAAWRAVGRFLTATASYFRRDVVARTLDGHRPRFASTGRRLRAFAAFVLRAPGALRSRRSDRRALRDLRSTQMRWEESGNR